MREEREIILKKGNSKMEEDYELVFYAHQIKGRINQSFRKLAC